MRSFSVLFLCIYASTVLLGQTVITHDISTGNLTIPGNSTNHYIITGTSIGNGSPPVPATPPTYSYNPAWVTITFDTPFQYTGGNLVVGILNNTGSYLNSSNTFNTSSAGSNRTLHYFTDGTLINPANPTAGSVTATRANTTFSVCTNSNGTGCANRQVGSGTTGSYQIPINTFYRYSYVQQIYTQAEIGATGYITSIAFEYTYLEQTKGPLTIYLGHTNKNTFANGSDWVMPNQMQQVFTGNKTFTSNSVMTNPGTPAVPAVHGPSNVVTIQSGYQGTVTLKDLYIKTTPNSWRNGGTITANGRSGVSCITVEGENNRSNLNPITKVNIVLDGENRLEFASDSYCGIQVNQGAQIVINAKNPIDHTSGKLWAECSAPADGSSGGAAAIGAPNYTSPGSGGQGFASQIFSRTGASCPTHLNTAGGNIIISSGTVTAIGGHGAGIGGGWYTWYDGFIVITDGIIVADCKRHSAGIGSGCPSGSGVLPNCYTANSSIIALPPCQITSFGRVSETGPPIPELALAGSNFLSYVNDPAKPRFNIRTQDREPYAPIYLDLSQIAGLQPIISQIYPSFDLTKVKVGNTNSVGNLFINGLFQEPVTFFTTASSTQAPPQGCGIGNPYLPKTQTNMNGQEIILPCLVPPVNLEEEWGQALCVNYQQSEAEAKAFYLKVTNPSTTTTINNLKFTMQDGTSLNSLTVFAANKSTVLSNPYNLPPSTTIYVRVTLNTGKPIGEYDDVMLIEGPWSGTAPLPIYIRKMVRQRVIDCSASVANYCVSTESGKASFNVTTLVGPSEGSIPLNLTINEPVPPPYDHSKVIAYYTISTHNSFATALAAKPLNQWTKLNAPLINGGTMTTNASLVGLSAGTYYIHWYIEYGTNVMNSGNPTSSPNDCQGFGPYIVVNPIDPGTITASQSSVCSGNTATLVSVTFATGGDTPPAYQWQSASSANGPWTNISGATSVGPITVTPTSPATYYRRSVTIDGSTYYSNIVLVNVTSTSTAATFNFANPLIYCQGNPPITSLPTTSANGITGIWDAPLPTTAGTYTRTFTQGGACPGPNFVLSITILPITAATFPGITTTYCYASGSFDLPTSSNGVVGTWNPSFISTANLGRTTYTFTPDPGQCTPTTATFSTAITVVGASIDQFAYLSDRYKSVCVGDPDVYHTVYDLFGYYNNNAATNTYWSGTGTLAGYTKTFSVVPAAGTTGTMGINSTNGTLTISSATTPGTYLVTCTITRNTTPPSPGCSYSKTIPILITACEPAFTCNFTVTGLQEANGNGAPQSSFLENPLCLTVSNTQGMMRYVAKVSDNLPPGGTWTSSLPSGVINQGNFALLINWSQSNDPSNTNTYIPNGDHWFTYTVTVGGVTCSSSFVWVVERPATASLSYPRVGAFCEGGTPSPQPPTWPYLYPNLTGTNRYQGGTYSSGPGLNIDPATGIIDLSTSLAGTYTIQYNIPNSLSTACAPAQNPITAPQTITIIPTTLPAPNRIIGNTTICLGDPVTLSVPSYTGVTSYVWTQSVPGTGWTPTSQNTAFPSIVISSPTVAQVQAGSSTSATYEVYYASTCAPVNTPIQVTINGVMPPPVPEVLSPTHVCSGTPASFYLQNMQPGITYSWSINSGGTSNVTWSPQSGTLTLPNNTFTTTPNITNANNAVNPIITVTANNTYCTRTTQITGATMTVWPATVAQPNPVSGPQFPCSGSTGNTYTITGTSPNVNYIWEVPEGWVITTPTPGVQQNTVQGVNLNSITVTAGTQEGQVRVRAQSACDLSAWRVFGVVPTTSPTYVNLYPPTSQVCLANASAALQFRATFIPDVTYHWEYVNMAGPTTSATEVVNVSFTTLTPGTIGAVRVTATSSCGSVQSTWEYVEIIDHYDLAHLNTRDTVVCVTSGLDIDLHRFVEFMNPQDPGDHTEFYFWTMEAGGNYIALPTTLITSITGTTTYYVSASSHDVCESLGKLPITITYLPPVTPTIAITSNPAPAAVCTGTPITFTATHSDGGLPTFRWLINGTDAGSGDTLVYTNPVDGANVSCEMLSTALCVTTNLVTSNVIPVKVNPMPVILPHSITICSEKTFTVTPANENGNTVPSGTTYTWIIETPNANITGASGQAVAQTNISQTLTNTSNTTQQVVYLVTPYAGTDPVCEGEPFEVTVTVERCPIDLLLTLFLEGPFDPLPAPHMNEYIQAIVLPFINPYGVPGSCQQIRSKIGPIGEVEDWILVEIWGNFSGSFPMITYDLLEQRALLLRPDGTVIDTTGQVPRLLLDTDNPVRVVVKHRDHLAVISNNLFPPNKDIVWDFTAGTNKAISAPFTMLPPMINIKGVTCLWAGDLDGNHIIDVVDETDFLVPFRAGVTGEYENADVTIDASVDSADDKFVSANSRIGLFSAVRCFKKR